MKSEQFADLCQSWRRMLPPSPIHKLDWRYSAKAQQRSPPRRKNHAADELAAMASAYLPEFNADQIQAAVADAFAKLEASAKATAKAISTD
jgi:hypothetical protein